jgi:hypothetical protein
MPRRHPSVRRALRVLCWALFSFALIQLLLGLDLERGPIARRDPDYALKERRLRALLARHPDRPLILALGSSRTALGLAASRMEPTLAGRPALTFNFGVGGAGPMLERLFLERLLATGIRPSFLLVEVLPVLFHQPDDAPIEESWLSGSRLRLGELVSVWPNHNHPARLFGSWCRSRFLPCYRDRARLGARLGFKVPLSLALGQGQDSHGWYPSHAYGVSAEERRRGVAVARSQYAPPPGDLRLSAGLVRALRALLARCRAERIPVALIVMPEGSEFQDFLPAPVRAGLDAFLVDLARAEKVPLIDARNWIEDADFSDSHHLMQEGAVRFTRRLEREALPPLLQSAFPTSARP